MGSLVPQDPIAGQECHIAGQDCFAAPPPPIAGQGCPGIQLLSPTAPAGPVDFSTSISPNMQVDNDVNHSPAWGTDPPLSSLFLLLELLSSFTFSNSSGWSLWFLHLHFAEDASWHWCQPLSGMGYGPSSLVSILLLELLSSFKSSISQKKNHRSHRKKNKIKSSISYWPR